MLLLYRPRVFETSQSFSRVKKIENVPFNNSEHSLFQVSTFQNILYIRLQYFRTLSISGFNISEHSLFQASIFQNILYFRLQYSRTFSISGLPRGTRWVRWRGTRWASSPRPEIFRLSRWTGAWTTRSWSSLEAPETGQVENKISLRLERMNKCS